MIRNYPVYDIDIKGIPTKIRMLYPTVNPNEWRLICDYLRTVVGIRINMCEGCGKAAMYSNTNRRYEISRKNTLQEVKDIVSEIQQINESVK